MQWNICGLVGSLLIGWSCVGTMATRAAADPAETPAASPAPSVELGTWVWQSEHAEDPAKREALLAFCKQRGIGRVLLQMHFDADEGQVASPEQLKEFLTEAAAASIKVEALDGAAEMGLDSRRERTLRRLATVLALHRAQPEGQGFAGVHYDIEPYLSARWKNGDMHSVAMETLTTLAAIRHDVKAAAPELTVAYDIPYWYDKKDELTLDYGGRRQNLQRHIQDLSDYVGVMSYRRTATGSNSVTEISRPILAYAAEIGKKAYVSLETVPLKTDAQISFNGTSGDLFLQTIDQIRANLGGSPGFGGILLHDYVHVRALLDGQTKQAASTTDAHP